MNRPSGSGDNRRRREDNKGEGVRNGVAATTTPKGRSISDAGDLARVFLDILRKKAQGEEDPLHRLVSLRVIHLNTCGGDCDSGDELDLRIAHASQGAAKRIRLKRKARWQMSRLPAPVPTFVGDLPFQKVGEVEHTPAEVDSKTVQTPNDELQKEPSVSSASQSDSRQTMPAESPIESVAAQMEEIHAVDKDREYKVRKYSIGQLDRRHERCQELLLAFGPRPTVSSTKRIPLLNFGSVNRLSDPRLDVYSSPAKDLLQF